MNASVLELEEIGKNLRASVVRTDAELENLGPEWKELFRRIGCDNVFLSFEWLCEWWFHFGENCRLFVVTVRDDKNFLVAVAPLYISCEAGPLRIRRLGFLGDRLVGSDYLDFLVGDSCGPTALEHVCNFVIENRKEWDYIQLSDIRGDSIAATRFRRIMEEHDLTTTMTFSTVCPYGKLPQSAEEFEAGLSSAFRKNLRYDSRTLQREGTVEFATVRSLPEAESAFNDLIRLHRSRFATRRAASAFVQPEVEAFHRNVFRSLAAVGWVRIHTLKLGGKCIAASYELSCARRLFTYQSGIDPHYGRFSVGQQLIHFAVQNAIQSGFGEFDFLRGNEPYKSKWVHNSRELFNLRLFDGRAKSRLAFAGKAIWASLHTCKSTLLSIAGKHKTKSGSNFPRRIIG